MRCTQNCNSCSQYWSTERAQFLSLTMPDSILHSQPSKVEWIRLQSFASSTVFTWPFVNWLPLLQASRLLFAGKTLPQPAGCRKCFPIIHQILKHGFFYTKGIDKLIGKIVLIVMVPVLINKGGFEPSYNDLKLMVWNCNYFCTNLIFLFFRGSPLSLFGQIIAAFNVGLTFFFFFCTGEEIPF